MAEAIAVPAPIRRNVRIESLDVIRGVALFGILLMNITGFGLPMAYENPSVWGGDTGANLGAWITTTMFFEGTQRGLFSLLFGAGFLLLTSRLERIGKTDVADIFFRRSLWLVLFGIIQSYLLLWTGEILYYYGATALLLYPMRRLAPKMLFILAGTGLAVAALWSGTESYGALQKWEKNVTAQALLDRGDELTEKQQDDMDKWKELDADYNPTAETLNGEIEAYRGSYFAILSHQAPTNAHHQSWWFYRYFFDLYSMMLIGMALFKLGVLTLERESRLYWTMVFVGYPLGLAVNYHEIRILMDGKFSAFSFLESYWTYDLGRLAMTLGHLGALLLFCRSGWLGWLQRALAAVGRMALSNYVSHSIFCAVIFYGFGFGLYAQLERHQLYYVVGAIWLFQLIVSPIWLKYYRFGPLEWAWRSLTYIKRQPMRKRSGSGTAAPQPQAL